jgi:hypothetical protein
LDGTPSLFREAIRSVIANGYTGNPIQGGAVFRQFFRLVIRALGPQWVHLGTGTLELKGLKQQLFGLWTAMKEEEEDSEGDEVECPEVGDGELPASETRGQR